MAATPDKPGGGQDNPEQQPKGPGDYEIRNEHNELVLVPIEVKQINNCIRKSTKAVLAAYNEAVVDGNISQWFAHRLPQPVYELIDEITEIGFPNTDLYTPSSLASYAHSARLGLLIGSSFPFLSSDKQILHSPAKNPQGKNARRITMLEQYYDEMFDELSNESEDDSGHIYHVLHRRASAVYGRAAAKYLSKTVLLSHPDWGIPSDKHRAAYYQNALCGVVGHFIAAATADVMQANSSIEDIQAKIATDAQWFENATDEVFNAKLKVFYKKDTKNPPQAD